MKNELDLTISIVHHKNLNLTYKCIESIFKETKNIKFEIILIDNCSNDGVDGITKKYDEIKIIKNEKKQGFAKNHNMAMKIAKGKYILILNNDTIILNNAIEKMIKFMENHPFIGVIGPKIYINENKKTYPVVCETKKLTPISYFIHSLIGFLGIRRIFHNSLFLHTIGYGGVNPNKPSFVKAISGCCMLIRKEILSSVGYLDENFYMYLEETDFCHRVNEKCKIYYYPDAEIIHFGAGSLPIFSKERIKLFNKSLSYFFKKHYGNIGAILYKLFSILLLPLKNLHSLYIKIKHHRIIIQQ